MKSLVRSAVLSLCLILGLNAAAKADSPRSERMQALHAKLAGVESQLDANDVAALDYYLSGIENVLSRYATQARLVCVSNGESGSFERFVVTNPATGTPYGRGTQLGSCRQAIAGQNQSLVCVSNGESGSFERFSPFDLAKGQPMGGQTQLGTCLTLVTNAQAGLMCQSNGEYSSFERFTLYNRALDRVIGGGTTLNQCLGSLKQ